MSKWKNAEQSCGEDDSHHTEGAQQLLIHMDTKLGSFGMLILRKAMTSVNSDQDNCQEPSYGRTSQWPSVTNQYAHNKSFFFLKGHLIIEALSQGNPSLRTVPQGVSWLWLFTQELGAKNLLQKGLCTPFTPVHGTSLWPAVFPAPVPSSPWHGEMRPKV